MRDDKEKATKLRQSGKSYAEISKVLNVPKSTLSKWFSNEEWSLDVTKKLQGRAIESSKKRIKSLNITRQIKLEELYLKADEEAQKEFLKHKNNTLFISGIMLYWGEGDKKFENGRVKVSNTDPAIIKIFRNFLVKFCNYPLENIKGWILLYPDVNKESALDYWSRESGIVRSNFIKSTVIKSNSKIHRLSYGTCAVHITNKYIKKKILRWIDLYKNELVKLK